MKNWMKITLLVLVVLICVGTFYYLMFTQMFKGTPSISRNSYLELSIYGEVPEREPIDPIARIFTGEPPAMDGLLACIRKAKIDPNIQGIVIRPMGLGMGLGKLEELKHALRDFKNSGKPVYAYLEMGANREYYLALEADMIFGSPAGLLIVNGFMGRSYYLKNTLDKIGVEADFLAHGKYKDAPDIFMRETMSPETREEVNFLLDDIFERYVTEISRQRDLPETRVRGLIDRGIFNLQSAYENGMIDTLLYYIQFKEYLEARNDKKPRFVSYSRYKKVPFPKVGNQSKDYLALVYCVGDIVSGFGSDGGDQGLIISEGMADAIRQARKDKAVKAIVLRIDSPGGSGIASDVIWREIQDARADKPVIVSVSDMAASGGYYLAMPADSIVAQPSSIVGSIGVFSGKFSLRGFYQKLGMTKVEIPRGKNADLFSEANKFNEQQRQIIRQEQAVYYESFVTKVAEGRRMSYQEVDAIAQGRIWTGKQAQENGLVDKLGGLDDAIQIAKSMVGIPPDAYVKLKVYPTQISFLDRILSSGLSTRQSLILELLTDDILKYVKGFLYFRDYEPLYLIPFYPEFE